MPRFLRPALAVALFVAAAGVSAADMPGNSPQAACLADSQVEDILQVDGVVYLAGRFTHVRPPGTAIGDPEEVARTWFAACDSATGAVLARSTSLPLICLNGAEPGVVQIEVARRSRPSPVRLQAQRNPPRILNAKAMAAAVNASAPMRIPFPFLSGELENVTTARPTAPTRHESAAARKVASPKT